MYSRTKLSSLIMVEQGIVPNVERTKTGHDDGVQRPQRSYSEHLRCPQPVKNPTVDAGWSVEVETPQRTWSRLVTILGTQIQKKRAKIPLSCTSTDHLLVLNPARV